MRHSLVLTTQLGGGGALLNGAQTISYLQNELRFIQYSKMLSFTFITLVSLGLAALFHVKYLFYRIYTVNVHPEKRPMHHMDNLTGFITAIHAV